jgi:tellurite resistance protein
LTGKTAGDEGGTPAAAPLAAAGGTATGSTAAGSTAAGGAASAPVARPWLARLPAGLFGIVLGVLGLAGTWRRLAPLTGAPADAIAGALFAAGLALLVLLAALWLAKLVRHTDVVRREWDHPVQGPLIALLPVCALLAVALTAPSVPAQRELLLALALAALAVQGAIAWEVVSRLATGRMPAELLSPVLYLPTVAGGFVGAMALAALGLSGWGALLWGMGLGAWALLEVRILHRLFAGPLPAEIRHTVGIEMAPAAVGTLAATTLWPQLPAEALMVGLGIASGPVFAVLTRWRWWTAVPFSAGFWSFSFPLAALASAAVDAVTRGGWPTAVAVWAALIASAVIAFLAVRTLVLLVRGKLLPQR